MIYAIENGDYAVTGHIPRRLDEGAALAQSIAMLLRLPCQGYYPWPVGGVGGIKRDLLPEEWLALGRRVLSSVPGVLVLGVRKTDAGLVFRLWVREQELEVTVAQ